MKSLIVILILLFTFSSFASSKAEMKSVMHTYLESIKTADKIKLKKVVSDNYYKLLAKDGQLEKLFKQQKKDDKKIDFDMKFQKYHNKKDHFLVNIKDKSQKEYGHYWYVVEFKNGKYKILKEEYLD